jgi:hypothetical protein
VARVYFVNGVVKGDSQNGALGFQFLRDGLIDRLALPAERVQPGRRTHAGRSQMEQPPQHEAESRQD